MPAPKDDGEGSMSNEVGLGEDVIAHSLRHRGEEEELVRKDKNHSTLRKRHSRKTSLCLRLLCVCIYKSKQK